MRNIKLYHKEVPRFKSNTKIRTYRLIRFQILAVILMGKMLKIVYEEMSVP